MSAMQKTLLVMAGGTGGHVYPAMAVADALHAQGWQIVWLTTLGGMENRLIAHKPYQSRTITMQGVRGKGALGWLRLPFNLLKAGYQTYRAIRSCRPTVALGMGGFAAFPGGLMAWCLRVPLVIHEQNSVAGLTNRVLARFANHVLTGFPHALGSKGRYVGNPVRQDISQLPSPSDRFAGRTGPLRVVVVGGSLGAAALNSVCPQVFAQLSAPQRPQIIHQAGEKHIAALEAAYQAAGVTADCRAFIQDMAAVYAWADLVICRAGALTVAELANVGVASLLVPFPFAVDDHQTSNARHLSAAGAAWLIPQSALVVDDVAKQLQALSRETCLQMAERARALATPAATQTVVDVIQAAARD